MNGCLTKWTVIWVCRRWRLFAAGLLSGGARNICATFGYLIGNGMRREKCAMNMSLDGIALQEKCANNKNGRNRTPVARPDCQRAIGNKRTVSRCVVQTQPHR